MEVWMPWRYTYGHRRLLQLSPLSEVTGYCSVVATQARHPFRLSQAGTSEDVVVVGVAALFADALVVRGGRERWGGGRRARPLQTHDVRSLLRVWLS